MRATCQAVTILLLTALKLRLNYIYFLSDYHPDSASDDTVTKAQAIAIIKACYKIGGKREFNIMQKYFARCDSLSVYDTLCTE